jgi:hypothetical protein
MLKNKYTLCMVDRLNGSELIRYQKIWYWYYFTSPSCGHRGYRAGKRSINSKEPVICEIPNGTIVGVLKD